MTENSLIKIAFFLGICHIVCKCVKNYPFEYRAEQNYLLAYIFFYAGLTINLLMLLIVDYISYIMCFSEESLFSFLCVLIGIWGIGILWVTRRKMELDYKYHNIPLGNEYKRNRDAQKTLIIVELVMIFIVTFVHNFLLTL